MILLVPLAWLYALAVAVRNAAYDRGWLSSERVPVPVISVGNLTAGGTGKTPLVEFLAGELLGRGLRVAVVSRGYRRLTRGVVTVADGRRVLVDSAGGGDEPVQIARKFPGAVVVVAERRATAARRAVRAFGAEVVVMDDGFQHRGLQRDLDIVVLDASRDAVRERLLPAGRRREPLASLRRAQLVAFSRSPEDGSPAAWEGGLRRWYRGPVIRYRYQSTLCRRASDGTVTRLDEVRGAPVFAFSGIGSHEGFLAHLRALGLTLVGDLRFGDHHAYSRGDVAGIVDRARHAGATVLMTTEKDVVRLEGAEEALGGFLAAQPVHYLPVEVQLVAGSEVLREALDRCLGARES